MIRPLITDKRLADKRFRRTEEAILQAFFALDSDMGVAKIAREAGVARSTVYTHHHAAKEIIPDYEKYILKKYRKLVKKMVAVNNYRFETMIVRMLIFVATDKRIFSIILRGSERRVFEAMVDELKLEIISVMRVPKKDEKIFAIYKSEVVVIIGEWCKKGFNLEDIDKTAQNIIYLTNTARMRLGVLK